MENFHPPDQQIKVDFIPLIKKIKSNWYLFVIFLGLSMSIAFVINRYSTPVYSVNATLYIPYSGTPRIIATDILTGLSAPGYLSLVNEAQILKANLTIDQTLNALDFEVSYYAKGRIGSGEVYKSQPFTFVFLEGEKEKLQQTTFTVNIIDHQYFKISVHDHPIPSLSGKEAIRFGENISWNGTHFRLEKNNPYFPRNNKSEVFNNEYSFWLNNRENLIKQYQSSLFVDVQKNTNFINISQRTTVPQKSADFINQLMRVYLSESTFEKKKKAANVLDFINEQIERIAIMVEESENALKEYSRANKIYKLENEGNLQLELLKQAFTEISRLELEIKNLENFKNYLAEKPEAEMLLPLTTGINDPTVAELSEVLAEEIMKMNSILEVANENSLSYKEAESKIAEVKNNIDKAIATSLFNKNQRKEEYQKKIKRLELELGGLPEKELEYLSIKRSFELNQNIYQEFLQKKLQAEISKVSVVESNKILEEAKISGRPITPKKENNYLIAVLVGLLIPLIIILLKLYYDDSVKDEIQVEKLSKIPVLGIVGHNFSKEVLVVKESPRSVIAESFRSIRTNLQFLKGSAKKSRVILVSSMVSGEGKTFVSSNLATILSYARKKVVLLGLDLRKPETHKAFNMHNKIGISHFLTGQADIDRIIQKTNIEGLDFIPAGPVPPNPSELIMGEEMEALLTILKSRYDYIILDTPPLGIVTDATILMNHSDINLFTLRQNYSKVNYINALNDLQIHKEIKNMYLIINDLKLTNTKYGTKYSYNYGYGYSYGKNPGIYHSEENIKKGWLTRLFKRI
jgi:tyrosine-protein kinase Etk/Wzc